MNGAALTISLRMEAMRNAHYTGRNEKLSASGF
jgi:hypothetical protein